MNSRRSFFHLVRWAMQCWLSFWLSWDFLVYLNFWYWLTTFWTLAVFLFVCFLFVAKLLSWRLCNWRFLFYFDFFLILNLHTALSLGDLMPPPRRYVGDEPGQDFSHSAGQSTDTGSQRCLRNLHMDVFRDSSGTCRRHVSPMRTTSHLLIDLILFLIFLTVLLCVCY